MSDDDAATPEGGRGLLAGAARPWRRYSDGLAVAICGRAARGESLMEICRDETMPDRSTVKAWARSRPGFGAMLAGAMAEGRHKAAGGRRDSYCPHVAALLCERIAEGMTLNQACRWPGMPGPTTVYNWMRAHPEFEAAYGRARAIQAHRRFDQVWEEAQAATPETAFLAKVRIGALQWSAARLAPKRYGVRTEAGPGEDGGGLTVIVRDFHEDLDEQALDGQARRLK